jgi:hypothetical protein
MPGDPNLPPLTEAEIIEEMLDPVQSVRNQGHSLERRRPQDVEYALNLSDIRAGRKLQTRVRVVPGEPEL